MQSDTALVDVHLFIHVTYLFSSYYVADTGLGTWHTVAPGPLLPGPSHTHRINNKAKEVIKQ